MNRRLFLTLPFVGVLARLKLNDKWVDIGKPIMIHGNDEGCYSGRNLYHEFVDDNTIIVYEKDINERKDYFSFKFTESK